MDVGRPGDPGARGSAARVRGRRESRAQLRVRGPLRLAARRALLRGRGPASSGRLRRVSTSAGVGLETKYTLAVVLVLLVAAFAVWRRDLLRSPGFPLAASVAVVLLVPNLIWEAGHGWASVHWFLNPPTSASDESRPQYVANL